MPLAPYRQTLTHSCLAACLLMLREGATGQPFDAADEQDLAVRGSRRNHAFYVTGIPTECARRFGVQIRVLADNAYFAKILARAFEKEKGIAVEHAKVAAQSIRALLAQRPLICHIDNHLLGDVTHSSHFVVLEKELPGDRVLLIDPWTGTRKRVKWARLEESIGSLKTRIRMCPLLFALR